MVTTHYSQGEKDDLGAKELFTVTNWTEDLVLVCGTDDAALGNVLGTLIKTLQQKGILKGTTATA